MPESNANKKEVRIYTVYLRNIERIIGAPVDPNEEGKFANYRDVDELTKSRIRDIFDQSNDLTTRAYLTYLLSDDINPRYLSSFIVDVAIDGMDQDEWEKNKDELSSPNRNS